MINGGVEWCFIHGRKQEDHHGILQAKGRKMIADIKIKELEDLQYEGIMEILYTAIDYDKQLATRKKKI